MVAINIVAILKDTQPFISARKKTKRVKPTGDANLNDKGDFLALLKMASRSKQQASK